MDKLKPCPICGKELTVYGPEDWKPSFYDPDSGGDPYSAICVCGFYFSTGTYDYQEFLDAANRRAQPENKPLTLDELREMDGEPVYVVEPRGKRPIGWIVVDIAVSGRGLYGRCYEIAFNFATYGKTWLAYRYKPEEETQ